MSGAIRAIYRALGRLRVYALESDGLIDRELAAYDAAFTALEQALAETASLAAVQTATGEALARYERLVGLTPRLSLDEETRRALVLYRLGSAPFDFDGEGMRNSIRATGMEAEISEDLPGEAISVRCVRVVDQSLDLDDLKDSVRTVLPAHLAVDFDLGHLTWDLFENPDHTWDALDALDMSWVDFDLNGHDLITI